MNAVRDVLSNGLPVVRNLLVHHGRTELCVTGCVARDVRRLRIPAGEFITIVGCAVGIDRRGTGIGCAATIGHVRNRLKQRAAVVEIHRVSTYGRGVLRRNCHGLRNIRNRTVCAAGTPSTEGIRILSSACLRRGRARVARSFAIGHPLRLQHRAVIIDVLHKPHVGILRRQSTIPLNVGRKLAEVLEDITLRFGVRTGRCRDFTGLYRVDRRSSARDNRGIQKRAIPVVVLRQILSHAVCNDYKFREVYGDAKQKPVCDRGHSNFTSHNGFRSILTVLVQTTNSN